MPHPEVEGFISRWSGATASERANSQLFLCELCAILDVPPPDPHRDRGYAFEFPVPQHHRDGSVTEGRIDLYKRGCFVLESKQFHAKQTEQPEFQLREDGEIYLARKKHGPLRGTERWDDAMFKARGQAERYIRSLPETEPNPPFLIVIDVGDTFEVYADFSQAGKAYLPFPDPRGFRIRLADLERDDIRQRLKTIWTDPFSLDPSRRSAEVTQEIAAHLAELAKSLEAAGHPPQIVAEFLTRCLFCMFAEDVGLLPEHGFRDLLKSVPDDGHGFEDLLSQLFREMNTGTGKGISVVLRKKLLQFNGGLFADDTVLPVNRMQLHLLRLASLLDWRNVEPAIFGTLLERALNPHERHKLGAHYTPRAYVERLVLPTVIEPIRAEWEAVRAAALTHARADRLKEARQEILTFHKKLCEVRVLDPACGSGNFLYVTLEHLKRLEGEVLDVAATFGESLMLEISTHTVDPHQFLGIEVNPRAATITELVLWIGYLQWHFRTRGQTMPSEPVLKRFRNIECRDAVLTWDGEPQPKRDDAGNIITVWDRRSYKHDVLTGREIPDETKRIPLLEYPNASPARWPESDYILGNPPFLGAGMLRAATGDGYAEALREAYDWVPESVDFVMYWWEKAANLTRSRQVQRFGFITTNSITQTFSRRVVQSHVDPPITKLEPGTVQDMYPNLALVFAIPDHPWVDTEEGAAVRIAMTVGALTTNPGELNEVIKEEPQDDGSAKVAFKGTKGKINSDLTIGIDVTKAKPLRANDGLSSPGVKLHGSGFIVTPVQAKQLGLGTCPGLEKHIRRYRHGKDLNDTPRGVMVIDLHGLTINEVRQQFPAVYQHVLTTVKPERDLNNEAYRRENWWLFGRKNTDLRGFLAGLRNYIATAETSKHRFFQFLPGDILPDNMVIGIGLDDPFYLGVLSSRIHVVYALAAGGWLGVGNDPRYNKSRCFDPFPFPDCNEAQKQRIRQLAEELDAHRKLVQAKNDWLTLTGMYNVLEKLRANQPLSDKEKRIHDAGLVSVLKQRHDELDAAVFDAYGWPNTLTDAQILEQVVALNAERAVEEAQGKIRWLRPEYQNPQGAKQVTPTLDLGEAKPKKLRPKKAIPARKRPWPGTLAARVKSVADALAQLTDATTPAEMASFFARAKPEDVQEILETLVAMGLAHRGKTKGTYLP